MKVTSVKRVFTIDWKLNPKDYEDLKTLLNADFSEIDTSTFSESTFVLPWIDLNETLIGLSFDFSQSLKNFNLLFELVEEDFCVTTAEVTSTNFDVKSKEIFTLRDLKENEYRITLSISDKQLPFSEYEKPKEVVDAVAMINLLLKAISSKNELPCPNCGSDLKKVGVCYRTFKDYVYDQTKGKFVYSKVDESHGMPYCNECMEEVVEVDDLVEKE